MAEIEQEEKHPPLLEKRPSAEKQTAGRETAPSGPGLDPPEEGPRTPSQGEERSDTNLLDDRAQIQERIAQLEKTIEEKEKIEQDYVNHLQRLSAEFENYKRRSARESAYAVDKGKELMILEFLKVLDNFENALKSLEDAEHQRIESIRNGLLLIEKQFKDLLENHGVRRIESVGAEFDPRLHEALFSEKVEGVPPNRIVEEYQAGYLFNDKLLRPAKVKVSK